MSLASLAGFIVGFGLLLWAVFDSTDNYMTFVQMHSVLIVFGGTVAAAYMSFQHTYVNIAFKALWWMVKKPNSTREGLNVEILRLVKWGYLVQQKGLQALENELKGMKGEDGLLNYCLTIVTTAHKPEELRDMMETAIEAEFERKTAPVAVLRSMGGNAPSFGMIGTLVGMIVMLQNFGADMSEIGAGMSLALTATLYGVISGRMLFFPAAFKLQQKEEIERFRYYMIMEGLIMLAEKRTPRYMQDRLNSFLEPSIHFDIDKQLR